MGPGICCSIRLAAFEIDSKKQSYWTSGRFEPQSCLSPSVFGQAAAQGQDHLHQLVLRWEDREVLRAAFAVAHFSYGWQLGFIACACLPRYFYWTGASHGHFFVDYLQHSLRHLKIHLHFPRQLLQLDPPSLQQARPFPASAIPTKWCDDGVLGPSSTLATRRNRVIVQIQSTCWLQT